MDENLNFAVGAPLEPQHTTIIDKSGGKELTSKTVNSVVFSHPRTGILMILFFFFLIDDDDVDVV